MHVEVSVALNFVISYLYNKLPRRRVDMLGSELEKGLKKKFEGHWYPTMPFKGSGFRCVRVNGEQIDPVIIKAAMDVGINLEEMKEYLPDELTLWIDPNEVSYRIGEKGQIKVLYSDRNLEENTESEDREVQATNRGFNPDAQSFNPDAQSFKPIDGLSASLGNLSLSPAGGLSPSSPISSSSWCGSQSTSPSGGAMFPTGTSNQSTVQAPAYIPKQNSTTLFTTATFAQTKFGSTKLKTNAKRPTRLSPTEFGNFFKQKAFSNTLQHPGITSPPRSRSLSPRDPRLEFILDQQQRLLQTQHQQQLQQQFQQHQLRLQQQQMNFHLHHQQQQQNQFQQKRLDIPTDHHRMPTVQNTGSLHEMFSGPSPLVSPGGQSPSSLGQSPSSLGQSLHPNSQSPHPFPSGAAGQRSRSAGQSPLSSPMHSPMTSIQMSPENHKALLEGLNMNNVPYSNNSQYHQLLLAS